MSNDELSNLERLLEVWRSEIDERAGIEADNRNMALAMLGKLIALGVKDLSKLWQAHLALSDLIRELNNIEIRECERGIEKLSAKRKGDKA